MDISLKFECIIDVYRYMMIIVMIIMMTIIDDDYDDYRYMSRWFEEHHPEQGNFTHESDRDAIRAVLAKQVIFELLLNY